MDKAAVIMKHLAAGMLLLLGAVLGDPAAAQSVQGYNNLTDLQSINAARSNLGLAGITTANTRNNPYGLVSDQTLVDDGQITQGSTTLSDGWTGTGSVGANITISNCSGASATLTVTAGFVYPWDLIAPVAGVPAGTIVVPGQTQTGSGIYALSNPVTCTGSTPTTTTSQVFTASATSSGILGAGQTLTDAGGVIAAGTKILGPIEGSGAPWNGLNVYQLNNAQNVPSETISAAGIYSPASVGKYINVSGAGGSTTSTTLSSALSTGAPITSLPVNSVTAPLLAGWVTVNDGAGHVQRFGVSAQTLSSATSIAVDSTTPSFAFPSGSTVTSPQLPLSTTIAAYVSPNSVTLATPALSTPLASVMSGAEVHFGTDNAVALQAGINAAEAAGVPYDIAYTQKGYLSSITPVVTSPTLSIYGHGVQPQMGLGIQGNQNNFNLPTIVPYLVGSYLTIGQVGGDGIDFQCTSCNGKLKDFGIEFAGKYMPGSTGHGIHIDPPHTSTVGLASGVSFTEWEDLTVIGTDSDHYAFESPNPMQLIAKELRGYGGGMLEYWASANAQVEYGNGEIESPYAAEFLAGSSHCYSYHNDSAAANVLNKNIWLRPQCNISLQTPFPGPYSNILGPRTATPTQYGFYSATTLANNIISTAVYSPDIEPSGLSIWPAGNGNGTVLVGSGGPNQNNLVTNPTPATVYQNTTGSMQYLNLNYTLTAGASTAEQLDWYYCTTSTCSSKYLQFSMICPAGATQTCTFIGGMPVPNGYWYEVLNSATGGSYSRVAGNLSALVSGNN